MVIPCVTRGLPACGKTTFALAWVNEDPEHRVRAARDDLRNMFHGRRLDTETQAAQADIALHAQVPALLRAGVSVVVDGTALADSEVDGWRLLADDCGAELEVHDLRGVPVDVCVARDAARGAAGGRLVGGDIIRRMAAASGRVINPDG
ncbi:AAA family ATPase [Micromonospora sp. NPDC000207]|uniref:AAA family ATPase n=1 Tax=Micromonospora sp. NPDC000207 TaxID=3154246 RepID=UPI00332445FB